MPFIIHINTALEDASVTLIKNTQVIHQVNSTEQKNHASFIFSAINEVLKNGHITIQNIDAVSVNNGPGSYTGLRVGLSTAKGLCYSLNKPLILLNTLELMALNFIKNHQQETEVLFCPMIDARRMEVYCSIYNKNLISILPQQAIVLDENSFEKLLKESKIVFFGSGSKKFKQITSSKNACFISLTNSNTGIAEFILNAFNNQKFSNVAYSEPNYLKEVYTTKKS